MLHMRWDHRFFLSGEQVFKHFTAIIYKNGISKYSGINNTILYNYN